MCLRNSADFVFIRLWRVLGGDINAVKGLSACWIIVRRGSNQVVDDARFDVA
jgi:hypothetical protein